MTDPLLTLAARPDTAATLREARDAVDHLLWNRSARAAAGALAAESALLGAWANAAFEGAELPRDSLRAGRVEDSPMGRTAAATLAAYTQVPAVAELITVAPLQALARLHTVIAAGVGPADAVGRPRADDDVADPLHSRLAAPAGEVPARLAALKRLLTADPAPPALLLAAIAHGEVAVVQPFAFGSGVVARMLTRVVLRARGVDPDGWTIPEAGLRMLGRTKYLAALRGYAGGTPEGVARWVAVHSDVVIAGATAAAELIDDLPADSR